MVESTPQDLTNLKTDWLDSGLNWQEFGDFTQADIDGLKTLWFPEDVIKRGQLQSIWKRHHKREQEGTIFYTEYIVISFQ